MRNIRLWIVITMCILGINARGVELYSAFRHYTSANGLPSNCIRDILQDEDGYIWFATDGGLARFDGRMFKNYEPSKLDCHNHIDNYVSCLLRCEDGLWLATDNGLLCYDKVADRLIDKELKYREGEENCIRGTVRNLARDKDGNVWIAMSYGGINRVDENLNVRHYLIGNESDGAGQVYVDGSGDVWATGVHGSTGLYRYRAEKDDFVKIGVFVDGKEIEVASIAMAADAEGRLWIGLWNDGLICYDPITLEARRYMAPDGNDLLHIHSVYFDVDGTILLGTDVGLVGFDPENSSFTLYEHNELQPGSLSGQFIYPIMRDNEGGLWVGTFYGGANYHAPQNKHFVAGSHSRYVNSVSGDIISSFSEDNNGNIYIGSEDGGVCRYEPSTGRYTILPIGKGGAKDNVHALCIDGDKLWIGTYSGGIKVYNIKSGRLEKDYGGYKDSEGVPIAACYSLFKDRAGDIWAAAVERILRYDRDNDAFVMMYDAGSLVSDIKQDSHGDLWFSTQGNGLHRYDTRRKEWRVYLEGADRGSIIHNHVSGIDIDGRGRIWAATGNGLALYDVDNDVFKEVETGDHNKLIFFVKATGDELWLGTARGLVRYNPQDKEMIYNEEDGLPSDQFSLNAVYESSNGTIYAGTVHGYTCFDPSSVGKNLTIPPLKFTGLEIQGRNIEVGDKRLPQSLNSVDCLELGPDDYTFSIGFAALSYVNPDNNRYMYMLEGFDKEWMTADKTNRVTYTNIPPGNYTLRIKGTNNDGEWNEAGISLPIHISPHWYNTWLMKCIYLLLVLLLLSMMAYVIMKRNNRRHREELELVKSRQDKELYEAKLNFFTTIAHEIRTPVSLIMGPLESVMKSSGNLTARQSDDVDIIHRNSQRLLALINQLLDFNKVESLAMDAKFVSTDIPGLVRSVAARFESSMSLKGIELKVECDQEHFEADVDSEALTKLISNLLNNARKFTRTSVTVVGRQLHDKDCFIISVSDDGNGISDADLKSIFKPFVQLANGREQEGGTGLGLSIVRRVVKAHSGTIDVKSMPGEGTTFVVALPLRQATAQVRREIADEAVVAADEQVQSVKEVAGTGEDKPVMLVVDDNPDIVHFLSSYFGDTYRVLEADGGELALRLLRENQVDLIVSDWMMPGMSGIELCEKVRADWSTSHIPFIMLTAKTDDDSKIEGMNCGADGYVEKPFSVEYLAARIENLLSMRRLLSQRFTSTPLEPVETLAGNSVDSEFLTRLTELIEENFSNADLSVDYLAQQLGISRTGLYNKIKTLVDNTPNELIQITRLKRAAQLLKEGRYRINEICYMVGFNSPSYFTKCFQKQFGMKPGEFK